MAPRLLALCIFSISGMTLGEVPQRFIIWFRNDLRVHDNPILDEAASWPGAKEVLPVYIFDPDQFVVTDFGTLKMGPQRARFLIESVADLRKNLQSIGSNLIVGVGSPAEILPKLVSRGGDVTEEQCGKTTVMWQEQVTGQELEVDRQVREAMEKLPGEGPTLATMWSGTLYERQTLPFAYNFSDIPDTYKIYKKKLEKSAGDWRKQVDQMAATPKDGELPMPTRDQIPLEDGLDFEYMPPIPAMSKPVWRRTTWKGATTYKGGEKSGLNRLQGYDAECLHKKKFGDKEDPNAPQTFAPWLTFLPNVLSTKLSPWLANGCLSPRMVAFELNERGVEETGGTEDALIFELMVRDFYRFSCAKHGQKIFAEDGPAGRDHKWYNYFLESETAQKWHGKDRKPWDDEEMLLRWKAGETGIPLIDANMRELAVTGYISHRGRQNVASFLALDLGIDWRLGADHFEGNLIDYDVCTNWGNWAMAAGLTKGGQVTNFPIMDWGAGGGRGHDYMTKVIKYDTTEQSKQFDKEGNYIKYWVAELRSLPAEYIHTPWRLTKEDMKKYDVIMGDYGEDGVDYFYAPREVSGDDGSRGPKARRQLLRREEGVQSDAHALGWAQPTQRDGTATPQQQPQRAQTRRQLTHTLAHEAALPGFSSGCPGCVEGESPSWAVIDDTCEAAEATQRWFEEWRERLEEWWIVAPHTDKLGPCLGALGLHLASRFESMLRALGARGGAADPPAHPMSSDCEWVAEEVHKMQLPDFPQLPSKFEVPPVVPIPRLLPDWTSLQSKLEQNRRGTPTVAAAPAHVPAASAAGSALESAASDPATSHESKPSSLVAVSLGAAAGAGVMLSFTAVGFALRQLGVGGAGRGAGRRVVMRKRPLPMNTPPAVAVGKPTESR